MKKTLLLFTLFTTLISYSQIVTIPDANFKAALIEIGVDTNNDGEIQVSEAEAVTELVVRNKNIDSLEGINSFINLTKLDCGFNSIVTLNLSNFLMLEELDCSNNELSDFILNNLPILKSLDYSWNNLTVSNVSNLLELESLNCSQNNDLTELTLSNLPKLKVFDCHYSSLSTLEMSGLNALEDFGLSHSNLVNLDLSNLINVKKINCKNNNNLLTLNTSNLVYLEELDSRFNKLTEVNLSNLINLKVLLLNGNDISTTADLINLNSLIKLEKLYLSLNQLTTLNISSLVNLEELDCSYNDLLNLDLTGLIKLKVLRYGNNQFNINPTGLENLTELTYLYNFGNELTSLDVSNLTKLEFIFCGSNQIKNLDFSNNPNLGYINVSDNDLETLNLKNGTTLNDQSSLNIQNNPNLRYICADTFEIEEIQSIINNAGYTNCEVNSFCTFEPGGDVFYIKGNVKLDIENNGCDINNASYSYIKFKVTDANNNYGIFSTDNSGEYNIALPEGQYSIEYQFPYTTYFDVSPTSFSVNFPTDASPFVQDICLTPNGTHNDLQVGIIPIEEARPGFDTNYKIVYANVGTTVLSGNVNLTFDDTVLDFVSASPSATTQNTGLINWSFTDLAPAEIKIVDVTMNLNTPTETPPLTGDEILCYVATISPTDNDEEPNDNSFTLKQTVVNSFDPNDKTCLEGNTVTPDLIGEYVHYLIRFENTGTASAINVVVKDIINTSMFDITTLEVYNSSHALETRIQNTNEVEFIFEGINLPFDDATNDGYLAFKIKTLPSLAVGDTFENKAEIYFDYNAPIITNNAQTTIETTASLDEFSLNSHIKISPNPTSNLLNIESNLLFDSLTIYDIRGRQLQTISYTEPILKSNFSTRNLTSGIYYISIKSGTSKKLLKFIKK